MGRSAARARLPESASPANRYPQANKLPLTSEKPVKGICRHRRRVKNPPFFGSRRSGPAAPLPRGKVRDVVWPVKRPEQLGQGHHREIKNSVGGPAAAAFSARKLASALWHLQVAQVCAERGQRGGSRLGCEFPSVCDRDRTGLKTSLSEPESSTTVSFFTMEKATKWDSGCLKSMNEMRCNYDQKKLHEDQLSAASVIPLLQAKLKLAHSCIDQFETERESARQKLNHFLRKLAEEKSSWQRREHEKVRDVLKSLKDDLDRERTSRKRAEIVNSKLVDELSEVKLSARKYLKDYEKEREARGLVENLCNEFAKEIGENKAEVESLKRESIKNREELDEERKMLQMAEVWREERVQLKLVDAKLLLEEKYAELIGLQAEIDVFLRARGCNDANVSLMKEAEVLREAADLMKLHGIEFHYLPSASGETCDMDELLPREEAIKRDIEQCYGCSPQSHASEIHTVSPETDIFLENPEKSMKMYANPRTNQNLDAQDDCVLENLGFMEGRGSCYHQEGNDPSDKGVPVRSVHEGNHGLAEWNVKQDNSNIDSEISEICSTTPRQSRKKMSSIGKFWRSSCTSNANHKKALVDLSNGKLSSSRALNDTPSPQRTSDEVSSTLLSVWKPSTVGSANNQLGRGAKRCIEWPRDPKTHSFKTKYLEARMKNQRVQIRHVLNK